MERRRTLADLQDIVHRNWTGKGRVLVSVQGSGIRLAVGGRSADVLLTTGDLDFERPEEVVIRDTLGPKLDALKAAQSGS